MEHVIESMERRKRKYKVLCSCGKRLSGANAIDAQRQFDLHLIDAHHEEEHGL